MLCWRVEGGFDLGKRHINDDSKNYFATTSRRSLLNLIDYVLGQWYEYDGSLPPEFRVLEIEAIKYRAPKAEEKSNHVEYLDEGEIIVEKGRIIREYRFEDLKELFSGGELKSMSTGFWFL